MRAANIEGEPVTDDTHRVMDAFEAFPKSGGDLLSHLISKFYEEANVIITTNIESGEWVSVFRQAKMTTGIMDHVTHHCAINENGNTSYRLAQSRRRKKKRNRQASKAPRRTRYVRAARLGALRHKRRVSFERSLTLQTLVINEGLAGGSSGPLFPIVLFLRQKAVRKAGEFYQCLQF
jgi:hypothetical protein